MLIDISDPENRWYIGITFARKLFFHGYITHDELQKFINDFYSSAGSIYENAAFRKLHRLANKHQDLYHKFRTLNTLKGHPIGPIDETFSFSVQSRRRPDQDQDG